MLSGVTAAGGLAYGATRLNWSDLMDAAQTNPLPDSAGVLVVVTLYGGNDGLNTVVPAGDSAYQSARPELAYQPHEVLDLGDGLGLNPGMAGLKGLWDQHRLAIVRGVGYPQPDHSHFRSMAIWQTGSPATSVPTGWLGRWLDSAEDDPLLAVSVEPVLPPLLAGSRTAAVSLPVGGLSVPSGRLGSAFAGLGVADRGDSPLVARAAGAVTDLETAVRVLGGAVHSSGSSGSSGSPSGGSSGQQSPLALQLGLVGSLVEAGVPTRAYSVSLGGFDTHADERATQQRLLGEVDGAVAPFVARMSRSARGQRVVVLVYSEFGRRVRANGSEGTDHGTANPVFLMGSRVRGGFYGEQPSLTDLDDGDLKENVDFRAIYATVLGKVLGTDPGRVLGDFGGRMDSLLV